MKYELVSGESIANPLLRVTLLRIISTRHTIGEIGFSVRLQRNYDGLWMPVGRRLCYGRNAWDFSTRESAEDFIIDLLRRYNGKDRMA